MADKVGKHTPVIRLQAKELYLYTSLTLEQIAERVTVPKETVHTWYVKEKWPEQRRKLERDLSERMQFETDKIIRENRSVVMRRHLSVGEKIETHIAKHLDRAFDNKKIIAAEDLGELAKAFRSSGTISGKVVGLDGLNSGKPNQQPAVNVLINTNFTPRKVDPPERPAITVDSYDEEEPF